MGHERVRAGGLHHHVEGCGAAWAHDVSLHAFEAIGRIAALVDVVPNLADRMERGKLVRSSIYKIDPDPFAWLGIQLPTAGDERVVLENAAIEHHPVEFPVKHRLHVPGILEMLRLN